MPLEKWETLLSFVVGKSSFCFSKIDKMSRNPPNYVNSFIQFDSKQPWARFFFVAESMCGKSIRFFLGPDIPGRCLMNDLEAFEEKKRFHASEALQGDKDMNFFQVFLVGPRVF